MRKVGIALIIAILSLSACNNKTATTETIATETEAIETEVAEIESVEETTETPSNDEYYTELKNIAETVKGSLNSSYMIKPIKIGADSFEGLTGIKPNMYDAFYGEKSSVENSIDTFIIVKTNSIDNFNEIKNLFNDYKVRLKQDSSLKDSLKLDKSQIGEYNNKYIVFSMLGAKSVSDFEEADSAKKEYAIINNNAINIVKEELNKIDK